MLEGDHVPAVDAWREERDASDRILLPKAQFCLVSMLGRDTGNRQGPEARTGLSPEAAAHSVTIARQILRRVGIRPILSLFAAALLAGSPIDEADAAPTLAVANARVVVLSRAVRLERGQVSLTFSDMDQAGPADQLLIHAVERACSPDEQPSSDAAPEVGAGPCRVIVMNLP